MEEYGLSIRYNSIKKKEGSDFFVFHSSADDIAKI